METKDGKKIILTDSFLENLETLSPQDQLDVQEIIKKMESMTMDELVEQSEIVDDPDV